MPISVGYGSTKTLNLPHRSRRPNSATLSLGVWETKQRQQERQEEMIYRERAQYLRDQRMFGNQQTLENQRFGNREALEGQQQEGRSRLATEKDELDWWQGEENKYQAAAEAAKEAGGGVFTDTGKKRYGKLQGYLDKLDEDRRGGEDEAGRLTPGQYHQGRAQILQKYAELFDSTRDTVPLDQQPGYERITPGLRRERRGADGVYEDQGPASRLELNPEQRKAQDEALFGTDSQGRAGQYRTDRYGTYFEPDKQEKEAPSSAEKMTEELGSRNALRDELDKDRSFDRKKPRDEWTKEDIAANNAIQDTLDEQTPRPPMAKSGVGDMVGGMFPSLAPLGAAGGAAAGAPGGGGGPMPSVATPEERDALPPNTWYIAPDGEPALTPPSKDDGVFTPGNPTGLAPIVPPSQNQPPPATAEMSPERKAARAKRRQDKKAAAAEVPAAGARPTSVEEHMKAMYEEAVEATKLDETKRVDLSKSRTQSRRERMERKKAANPARRAGKTIDEYLKEQNEEE